MAVAVGTVEGMVVEVMVGAREVVAMEEAMVVAAMVAVMAPARFSWVLPTLRNLLSVRDWRFRKI